MDYEFQHEVWPEGSCMKLGPVQITYYAQVEFHGEPGVFTTVCIGTRFRSASTMKMNSPVFRGIIVVKLASGQLADLF